MGWVVGAFFVAVFPGNIAQYQTGTDAFGLNTDSARLTGLLFQPVLVAWALWSTGAWRSRQEGSAACSSSTTEPVPEGTGPPRSSLPQLNSTMLLNTHFVSVEYVQPLPCAVASTTAARE